MTWFDLIVILIMGLSILFAAFRGISREMTTITALGLAAFLAFWLAGPIASVTGLGNSLMTNMLLITMLFASFFLAISIGISLLLSRLLGKTPGRIDRSIGGVLGFLRGWMIVGLGFLALDYYFEADRRPDALDGSLTSGFARSAAEILENLGLETGTETASRPATDKHHAVVSFHGSEY